MFKIRLAAAGAIAVQTILAVSSASAEPQQCGWLRQEYVSVVRQSGGGGANAARQLQQAEAQAQRLNCRPFLFFGPRPAPQCPSILANINRLQWQLRGAGPDMRYRAEGLRRELQANGCYLPNSDGTQASGTYRTICVRTCDGYYFPIDSRATPGRFKTDAAACQSMYGKEGEAELFYYRADDDPAVAVSVDGKKKYGEQPYAFQYRKTYNPVCVAQLQDGIESLKQRYTAALQDKNPLPRQSASLVVPIPTPRPTLSEDPETLADTLGGLSPAKLRTVAAAKADTPTVVRQVGPEWYADLYSLTKPADDGRPVAMHDPGPPLFTSSASAAELPARD